MSWSTTLTQFLSGATSTLDMQDPAILNEFVDAIAERVDFAVEPRMIRGLRVSGPAAGSSGVWPDLLELAESTEINEACVAEQKQRICIVDPLSRHRLPGDLLEPEGIAGGSVQVLPRELRRHQPCASSRCSNVS